MMDKSIADELQLMKAHWNDLAQRSNRDNRPYFTDFLPREDIPLAEAIARKAGVMCQSFGGTNDTLRVMLCFVPEFISVPDEQFPMQCLTFSFQGASALEHRDFLGTFMACNIKRNTIGDILIGEKMAQVFVCKQVAPVILQEISRVGRVGVKVTEDVAVCLSASMYVKEMSGSIASLRADAVVAFVTHLSREKSAQLIRQKKLICRHVTIETPSSAMQIGDVFSIRGYGKFKLAELDGTTRKGRYHIIIHKYQ